MLKMSSFAGIFQEFSLLLQITYFPEHHQVAALYLHVVGLVETLLLITLITSKAGISASFKNLI